jgi:hypothetical protein
MGRLLIQCVRLALVKHLAHDKHAPVNIHYVQDFVAGIEQRCTCALADVWMLMTDNSFGERHSVQDMKEEHGAIVEKG